MPTADATVHRVDVDGVGLHVEEAGRGDPVLLIQGLGYATWAWQRQVPVLAERWRTLAFDNRGAGRSETPPPPYRIEDMADDAVAVLEARGARPAHVVGVSMGGYIAQTLALRHPDAVRSLVLVATSAGGEDAEPLPQETFERWMAHAGRPPEEYARATMPLSFAPGWTEGHVDEYEALLRDRLAHPTSPEAWKAQYAACEAFAAEGAPVEAIAAPTLVIHGDADRILPVGNGRTLARRIPGARLVELRGGGHLAFIEQADRFNQVVADFLAEVDGGP